MEFKDLPFEVQLVAASLLHELLKQQSVSEREPAEQLAQVIKSAFVSLYSS